MKSILPFLKKLKKNNNKAWFDAHRDEYEKARAEFLELVTGIITNLQKKDKELKDIEPSKTIFRIYRDIRFSKDKTPYKKHLAAEFGPGGRHPELPGYYIHFEPGNCFLCAGIFMPEPEALKKIRQEIDYHFPEFKKILADKNFKKYFGSLREEEKAKLPPKGFSKDSPAIDILKNKSFIVLHSFSDADIEKKDFAKKSAEKLAVALKFNQFLRRALE